MNSRNFCGSIDSSNVERVAALIKAMLDRRLFVMTEYYPHYRVTGMGLMSSVRYLTNKYTRAVNTRDLEDNPFITVCDSGGVWQISSRDHVVIDGNSNTIVVEKNNDDYTAVFKIRPVPQQMIDDFAGMEG